MERRLTTQDVMALYSIKSEGTIVRWKRDFGLPYRKIGKECFFLESELEAWDVAHKLPLQPVDNHIKGDTGLHTTKRGTYAIA